MPSTSCKRLSQRITPYSEHRFYHFNHVSNQLTNISPSQKASTNSEKVLVFVFIGIVSYLFVKKSISIKGCCTFTTIKFLSKDYKELHLWIFVYYSYFLFIRCFSSTFPKRVTHTIYLGETNMYVVCIWLFRSYILQDPCDLGYTFRNCICHSVNFWPKLNLRFNIRIKNIILVSWRIESLSIYNKTMYNLSVMV